VSVQAGSMQRGRVRYSRLKGAAREEASMPIQWCWDFGEWLWEEVLERERREQREFGDGLRVVGGGD
jgi:hypothetical protein